MEKSFKDYLQSLFKRHIYLFDEIDTVSAAERIKSGVVFKGPNVWILAFAIVIASVGLNVNSTAVIIGAMLISPLMGPIIGLGLAMGTNDVDLLKSAARNLLVMVAISLLASTLFFILSPLSLVNPTELEARTSPTIYDVLIAFFGGLAGILENSRKERGTVLSGVAIATALMPPLCTAGYGLAHLNFHYFFGALYLFIINGVFIALATYLMVKYLRFRTVAGIDESTAMKRRKLISTILAIVVIPSLFSAFNLIRDNNYELNVRNFVSENILVGPHTYIYDYHVKGRSATLSVAGEPLTDSLRANLFDRAQKARIKPQTLNIQEHSLGMSQADMNKLIQGIYDKSEQKYQQSRREIDSLIVCISQMQAEIDSLKTPESGFLEMTEDLEN